MRNRKTAPHSSRIAIWGDYRASVNIKKPYLKQSFLKAAESWGVEPHTRLRVPVEYQTTTLPQAFYSPTTAARKLYHKQWERANKNTFANEDVFTGSLNGNGVPSLDTHCFQYTRL